MSGDGEPLRLGYVVDTLVTGGAERLVVTFAETVKARADVELTVFVLNDRRTPFRETLEATGTPVVTLPGRSLLDPLRFARLLAAVRRRGIEVLHAHLATSTTLGSAVAALLGVPFATTIHNVRPSVKRTTTMRRLLYRAAIRRPGRVLRIAVGQAVADAAREDTGGRDCVVVPNAISATAVADPGARDRMRRDLDLGGALTLIAVGAVIGQKAYPDLLHAFAKVRTARPDARLLVVGHAPDPEVTARVQAAMDNLALHEHVDLLGFRRDIPELLAAGDVFVSASHWEGAPVSLLEAMANALPCIVTDVGENRLVLSGTGAPLVPPGRPDALARAILDLVERPDRLAAIGAAMRDRAGAYGAEAWVGRLLALYGGVARDGGWRPAGPADGASGPLGAAVR